MIAVVDYHKGNLKSVERGLTAAGGDAFITDDASAIARADAIVLPGVGAFADAATTMQTLGQTDVIRRRIAAGVPFLGICLGMHLMFEEGIEGAPEEDDEQSTHNAPGLAILPGVVTAMPRVDQSGHPYKVPHVGWNTIEEPSASDGLGGAHQASSARAETSSGRFVRAGLSERLDIAEAIAAEAEELRGGAVPTKRVPQRSEDCLSDWALPLPSADQVESPLFAKIPWGTYFYFTHSFIAPPGPFVIAQTTHSTTFPCAVQYGDAAFGVQFHPEKSSDAGAQLLRNFVRIAKGA